MDSTPVYILPDHLRDELKKPIGSLITGDQLSEKCTNCEIVLSIGDYVSASLIKQNIFPQIMIIDFQTKRNDLSISHKKILQDLTDYTIFTITNPAGVITKELMDIIQSLCKNINQSDRYQIIIKGEEDLAALPVILYAPINATIIYGMPYKGVVIVPSTEEYKEKVRFFLSMM